MKFEHSIHDEKEIDIIPKAKICRFSGNKEKLMHGKGGWKCDQCRTTISLLSGTFFIYVNKTKSLQLI